MAKIIIDVCWEDKKFVEDLIKTDYEVGSMLDTEIRMGLKEAVVVSSEQEIINKIKTEIKHNSELFINEYGEESLAIYEDDVIEIIDKYTK